MVAVTRPLLHIELTPALNLQSISLLQFTFPYFKQECQGGDVQLLGSPCHFWAYFSAHDGALVLKNQQIMFEKGWVLGKKVAVLQFLFSC